MDGRKETPSAVLRDTLLEYSRQRRRHDRSLSRDREHHRRRERRPSEQSKFANYKQCRKPVEKADLAIADPFDKQPEIVQEASKESTGINTEAVPFSSTDSISLEGEADSAGGDTYGFNHPIYLHKEQHSYDSLMVDDISSGDCAYNCCTPNKFFVPSILKDGDKPYQTRFIQKVFLILFIKALVVLSWLKVVESVDEFRNFYEKTFRYHFLSGAAYVIIKVIIRLTKNFRKRHCCLHFILHLMELVAAADFVTCAVNHWLGSYFSLPRKILMTIAGVCLFFVFVGNFMTYDITDGVMVAAALIVTLLMAIHQILHVKIFISLAEQSAQAIRTREMICASTVLVLSELVITIIMVELKSVLTGRRFTPSTSDWFFTSIYVI